MGPIQVALGLKQGCPCSPILFSLYFDRVEAAVQQAATAMGGGDGAFFQYATFQLLLLLFADDVVLVSRARAGLEC